MSRTNKKGIFDLHPSLELGNSAKSQLSCLKVNNCVQVLFFTPAKTTVNKSIFRHTRKFIDFSEIGWAVSMLPILNGSMHRSAVLERHTDTLEKCNIG
jgi:hypothetical protein